MVWALTLVHSQYTIVKNVYTMKRWPREKQIKDDLAQTISLNVYYLHKPQILSLFRVLKSSTTFDKLFIIGEEHRTEYIRCQMSI